MPILTPEQQAREHIDRMLKAAGWRVQPRERMSLRVEGGVAVCEHALPSGFEKIVEDLKAALEQFWAIIEDLGGEE